MGALPLFPQCGTRSVSRCCPFSGVCLWKPVLNGNLVQPCAAPFQNRPGRLWKRVRSSRVRLLWFSSLAECGRKPDATGVLARLACPPCTLGRVTLEFANRRTMWTVMPACIGDAVCRFVGGLRLRASQPVVCGNRASTRARALRLCESAIEIGVQAAVGA